MSTDSVIAILAGGLGKRLWPLSSEDRPKQFLPLFQGRSMLQQTFERAAEVVGQDAIFLIGVARHESIYRDQLPHLGRQNLILEPTGRGTAAAVALATIVCSRAAPGASVATIPSDHIIPDPGQWMGAVRAGLDFAAHNERLVCLGTSPRAGETKFGYLVVGEIIGEEAGHPIREVMRFVEKPDSEELDALIVSGSCIRNMGTLMFRPQFLKDEMWRFAPQIIKPITDALEAVGQDLSQAYEALPSVSIDVAVLQQSQRVAVVLGEISSADAGDFVTLGDAIGRDDDGNAVVGRVVTVDANDNTVFADDVTVALVGVSDLVVVVEGDRILVCPAGETQRIKQISDNS